ncbi:hypothetical protein GAYE_SCF31G4885 [Galdieria yellowstonensis]|uniref:Uncharacterized protein n=1 Tax=Galdieria yellowstonensis TaxID=3028027 RepID=A0AAV9II09_9RHOD|nr:hypothetical protein GAYE_SCF31G4885 [Galdieria yellowstonensis]
MEYLGPNRRGRPGKSFGRKSRGASRVSHVALPKNSDLWDNSLRFAEDAPAEDEEDYVSLDLESSSHPVNISASEEETVDDQSLSFIEQVESSLKNLSPIEISHLVLSPCSSSTSVSKSVHLLDLEFANDSSKSEKDAPFVDQKPRSSTVDVNLLSSSSNEAFDAWLENLSCRQGK